MWLPQSLVSRDLLPLEGATAPAVRQSRFRHPALNKPDRECDLGLRGGGDCSLRKMK